MKRIKILFSLIAFVAIMVSCNKEEASSADGFATVSFRNIGVDSEVISTITPSRSGEDVQTGEEVPGGNEDGQGNTDGSGGSENGGTETEEPFDPIVEAVKNGFKLSVVTYDETVYTCTDYEKFNNGECENVELRVGNYTVVANMGNPEVEGFEQPYYSGSKDIHLDKGENVDVDLECKLANSILKINYTDNFKKYFSTYSSCVSTSNGNTVEYVQDETRGAYLASGEVTVYVKAKKMGANEATLNVGKYTLNPQYEYALTLDVDASNAIMKVTFSENWEDESVIINVSDAALNANAPYMVGEGVESGEEFTIVEGVALNETLKVTINAEAEIASCLMTTTSDYLKGKGWSESVDLTSADESTMSDIKASGVDLKGFSGSLSQMAYLDFTELVRTLPKESPVDVRLKVTDKFGKVSEEFVFLAEIQDCRFSVAPTSDEVPFKADKFNLGVTLLEGDINAVQFAMADGQPLNVLEISGPMNVDGLNHYIFSLNKNDGTEFKESFKISSKYLTYTPEIEIPVYFGLEMDNVENDVWAKRATVHLYNETVENITIQKKESDGNWVNVERILNEDGRITAYDLSPDTKIALRAVKKSDNSKATNEIELKTWKAVSLPNGDMEYWTVGPDGMEGHGDVKTYVIGVKYNHTPYRSWERWYPYSSSSEPHWDTVNMLTTSLGEEKSGFLGAGDNKRWTRYVANSGTIRTTGKDGNGALIRTVGWGNGNTAAGTSANVINNITPGELYLGTYNSSPQYGITFDGLPDGLRFYYKYVTKNADRYVLNIQMYSGNTLMVDQTLSAEEALPVNEWTEKYIPFVYLNKQNEPTTLSIVFKSGTSTSKDDIRVFAPFGNLTTGENTGSELYLDNIELIYE